jgi:UTP:GlnB (protein PII) uridylyltransferase
MPDVTVPCLLLQRAASAKDEIQPLVQLENGATYSTLRIRGKEGTDTLMALTGIFGKYDVSVLEASINTDENGNNVDMFRVSTSDMQPVRFC